jgi:hypothetical protein
MRTHYGPWQPCWISNQHQKHNSGRGPSSEHFWQVWLISVQRFERRRFKCEKLMDGRTTDAYQWQKLTWPMVRWAKNQPIRNKNRLWWPCLLTDRDGMSNLDNMKQPAAILVLPVLYQNLPVSAILVQILVNTTFPVSFRIFQYLQY